MTQATRQLVPCKAMANAFTKATRSSACRFWRLKYLKAAQSEALHRKVQKFEQILPCAEHSWLPFGLQQLLAKLTAGLLEIQQLPAWLDSLDGFTYSPRRCIVAEGLEDCPLVSKLDFGA